MSTLGASADQPDDKLPSWEEATVMGSVKELRGWAQDDHHFDPDGEWVLRLAATSIVTGAWRNDSPIEDIHAGAHAKRGYTGERGPSDAEMMAASMRMSGQIAQVLAVGGRGWMTRTARVLTDHDTPLSGQPGGRCLSDMVTKSALGETTTVVRRNLRRFSAVEREVGWERFLLGTALCSANSHVFWGNPAWSAQVQEWADRCEEERGVRPVALEAALIENPTAIPVETAEASAGEPVVSLQEAVRTALGYANGHHRWHAEHCGNTDHWPTGPSSAVTSGMFNTLGGLPQVWLYAAMKNPSNRR